MTSKPLETLDRVADPIVSTVVKAGLESGVYTLGYDPELGGLAYIIETETGAYLVTIYFNEDDYEISDKFAEIVGH